MPENTCDICGARDFNCTEVFSYLQTDGVKVMCYDCADIVNRFANRVHKFAEKEANKAQDKMLDRVTAVHRDKKKVSVFFFLLNLRSFFKKRVVQAAFEVGIKREQA